MSSIASSVGLASGIDTASLINQLLAIEARPVLRLQQRVANLQAQQTALLDINSRLLNLKSAAESFRIDNVFRSTVARTGDATSLVASADDTAAPGSYQFTVRQLATTSQVLSRGFADRSTSPLGLDSISFGFGRGRLEADRSVDDLNGGAGIERGKIRITDGNGEEATVDLTDAITMSEVLDRINGAEGIDVSAEIRGDRLVLTDGTGGELTVAEFGSGTAAAGLGILGSSTGGVLEGDDVFSLAGTTALRSLNDGNGVLIRDFNDDLNFAFAGGGSFGVDLGRVDEDITGATLLSELNDGLGIATDGDGTAEFTVELVEDGGGTQTFEIDLTGAETVGDLIDRFDTATNGKVALTVNAAGDRFDVTYAAGAPATSWEVSVLGGSTDAAESLGILNEDGFDQDDGTTWTGEQVPSTIDLDRARTVQDVVDRINAAAADAPGGPYDIVASIDAGGALVITNDQGSEGTITGPAGVGNGGAASDLGIDMTVAAGSSSSGDRVLGSLGSVLLDSLNGGAGVDLDGTRLDITTRDGTGPLTITIGTNPRTLDELVEELNTQLGAVSSVSVRVSGTGLVIEDAGGGMGNLVVGGDLAEELGIATDAGGVAADSVRGTNLQLRTVDEASLLSTLNYGRGIGTGSFRITDGFGETATVNIGSDARTLADVIDEINSRGLKVEAAINETGDGLVIRQVLEPGDGEAIVPIEVESVSGTTAADLRIIGTGSDLEEGASIDGSYEPTIDLSTSDSLDDLLSKIADAKIPVSASVISSGSGATPYRLSITSGITGRAGDLVITTEGQDLGISTMSRGRDARMLFGGGEDGGGFLVTSSSNVFDDVIDGVKLTATKVTGDPVTVDIVRNTSKVTESVQGFVDSFNEVIARIDEYDYYDVETEKRGVLLGNGTVGRLRATLFSRVQAAAEGVDGSFRFLSQVGISIGKEGRLEFDASRFNAAYEDDPDSVEALFTALEGSAIEDEEISPGVTVQRTGQTFSSRGFGKIFDDLTTQFTDSIDGVLTLADKRFDDQIDLINDRIESQNERLERKRAQLTREFAQMELAIAQLQSQSQALGGITAGIGRVF